MEKKYKYDYKDIENKIFELEEIIDASRFTFLKLESRYGWKFAISHPKKHEIYMKTGQIQKFVPESIIDQPKIQSELTYDDLLIIASRAMEIHADDDPNTVKYVEQVSKSFRNLIPLIVEKFNLREHAKTGDKIIG